MRSTGITRRLAAVRVNSARRVAAADRAAAPSVQLVERQFRTTSVASIRDLEHPREYQGHDASHPGPVEVNSADEAVSCIKSGDSVFLHSAAATPTPLVEKPDKLQAMVRHAKTNNLKDITPLHIHVEGNTPYQAADAAPHFRSTNFFTGANAREAINAGRADYVPIFLSEVPLLFRRGEKKINVALISAAPADKHGFYSLGMSVDVTRAALQMADKIVAMVNPQMPRTFGDATIHASHLDTVWHHDMPCHQMHIRAPKKVFGAADNESAAEDAIGKLIAENLVKDGATLQMGIGGIPDAVLRQLKGHKDLGIHSEMFSDGIIDLVMCGAITNANKSIHPGRIVGGFAVGTKKLYDFMDDNPGIIMRDIAFVNNTFNIAKQPRMTAINSCIEIDITGQVVSDSIGTRVYSGVGGQMDFIRGAGLCPDGVPILALPSTTSKGESRIVDFLKPGGAVVTTRAHVHYVVTEWGIAHLFGKSLRERAQQLIKISHPAHREKLTAAAKARMLL